MNTYLLSLLGSIFCIQITILILFVWYFFFKLKPKSPKKNTLNLKEKDLYDIVNTLLEHCKTIKDEEGSMLLSAYGKHLYDQKVVKKSR